jgi:hypothetical protein
MSTFGANVTTYWDLALLQIELLSFHDILGLFGFFKGYIIQIPIGYLEHFVTTCHT